jgi:hypothetical protein
MVDGRHPAPCPRLTLRPAPTRRTGVSLGTKQALSRRKRRRGAVPTPSARPLCAQARHGRHHRGAASGTISALFFQAPDSASRAARRDHHSERHGQPKLTFCKYAKSQSWRSLARTAAQACAARIKGLGTRTFSQLTSLRASGRRRSPRTLPADLAEEGPGIRTCARRL